MCCVCSKLSKRQHLFDKLRTGRCSFLSSFFVLLLPISSCEICTAVSGGPHISRRRAHESHLSFFFLFFLLFDLLRSQSELRLRVRVRLRPSESAGNYLRSIGAHYTARCEISSAIDVSYCNFSCNDLFLWHRLRLHRHSTHR